eukprot:2821197-Pyramimonas_sp.AAC.2
MDGSRGDRRGHRGVVTLPDLAAHLGRALDLCGSFSNYLGPRKSGEMIIRGNDRRARMETDLFAAMCVHKARIPPTPTYRGCIQ